MHQRSKLLEDYLKSQGFKIKRWGGPPLFLLDFKKEGRSILIGYTNVHNRINQIGCRIFFEPLTDVSFRYITRRKGTDPARYNDKRQSSIGLSFFSYQLILTGKLGYQSPVFDNPDESIRVNDFKSYFESKIKPFYNQYNSIWKMVDLYKDLDKFKNNQSELDTIIVIRKICNHPEYEKAVECLKEFILFFNQTKKNTRYERIAINMKEHFKILMDVLSDVEPINIDSSI